MHNTDNTCPSSLLRGKIIKKEEMQRGVGHITAMDAVSTKELPQKKIRMILQLNPLKGRFTVTIYTAFECEM